jgi:HSP20 family protein
MFELMRAFTTNNGKAVDPLEKAWADLALPALGWAVQATAPPADVVETENEFLVRLDMPGHRAEEINIKFENDVLSVESERKLARGDNNKGETYHRTERGYGKFFRSFVLPGSVDSQRTSAHYQDGVLEITLPKREEAKPRTIKIGVK